MAENEKRKQALEGIRVVELTRVIVGPHTGRMLAEHGATVVRVETIHHPDTLRIVAPYKDSNPGVDRAGYFSKYNANKLGMTLNLAKSRAIEVFKRLVAWADIVIDSNSPGVMPKLGLAYEDLRKIRPDIIMLSTNQMGQTGPWRMYKAYGAQAAALAGFYYLTGHTDEDPPGVFGAYTDMVSPQWTVCALLAALDYRRRTGKGQHLDHSQFEAGVHWLATTVLDYTINGRVAERLGNRDPSAAPHGVYPCRGQDRWCAITVFSDQEWRAFGHAIGDPPWVHDERFATLLGRKQNEDELDALVAAWTSEHEAEEVMARLQRAGVSAGVVATGEDIHRDPQLQHRGHFQTLEHSEMGSIRYDMPPYRLSKTPARLHRPAPCLGEHNEYICREILGLSADEVADLMAEGVLE